MGRVAVDIYARQPGETNLEWVMRRARLKADARDKTEPIVPVETQRQGDYRRSTVMHVETNTRAETYKLIPLPRVIEQWHEKGLPGFEEPAMDAMRRCIALWEARPLIGSMAAQYKPAIKGGANDYDRHVIRALDDTDELDRYRAMFHPAHWRVFEAVVRYDKDLQDAGMEANAKQSRASARAIVGLVANVIASRMRG